MRAPECGSGDQIGHVCRRTPAKHGKEVYNDDCMEGFLRGRDTGQGHINRTVRLEMDSGREYVLQKINTYVFRDPVHLMENAAAVTSYLRLKSGDLGAAIHFIPTKDGKFYYIDEDGFFWRM